MAAAIISKAFRSIRPPAIRRHGGRTVAISEQLFAGHRDYSNIVSGINLPSFPSAELLQRDVPNSELLNPADFGSGNPSSGRYRHRAGQDVTTFVNETIDGGSVTTYDATGTQANLQLRWAKTDSVAAGGTDTWELFYQTDSATAAPTIGLDQYRSVSSSPPTGQQTPTHHQLSVDRRHRQRHLLGNITVSSPAGAITQYANTNGTATVNNLQQNGYAAGQLESIAVYDTGNINGTFSNGQTVALANVPLVHFNSPNNLKSLDGGAYSGNRCFRRGASRRVRQDHRAIAGSSNTDIATEFTKLIVTQQAYSANTKVITTANQMSQDLLNVIR